MFMMIIVGFSLVLVVVRCENVFLCDLVIINLSVARYLHNPPEILSGGTKNIFPICKYFVFWHLFLVV